METQAALPQLDEAISYLQAEIAALRAGEKDSILPALAVAVAAGEAPLPEPQFTPLLARWTPAPTSFSAELAALVDQFEAAKRREKENELQKELRDGTLPMHSALQRVRGKRSRPRTRPRRRFEDPDTGDASASASDGTPTASPRDNVVKKVEGMKEDKEMEEKVEERGKAQDQAMETKVVVEVDTKVGLDTTTFTKEIKDVGVEKSVEERCEGEDMAKEKKVKGKEKVRKKKNEEEEEKMKKAVEVTKEKKNEKECVRQEKVVEKKGLREEMIVERQTSEEKKNVVSLGKKSKVGEKDGREKKKEEMNTVQNEKEESGMDKLVKTEEKQVAEDKNSEKAEAEAALASLKSLRKSMLLDVLSKIVSVAKSKGVDPAMFTTARIEEKITTPNEKAADLKTIQDRVASGVVCEWAQFAEQVYLFCQHVVANAEQREQQEARRKGVELLHFARTLTETLRKASVKKEMTLLQRIQDAEQAATARKEEEAALKREATSFERYKHENDKRDEHVDKMNERAETIATAAAPAKDYNSNMTTYGDDTEPSTLTPTRALRRIRMRPSLPSDETESFMSGNPRKRVRGALISASEDASGSESHDASASEADGKSRGSLKSSKTSAKRTPTRRRRPIIPATRTSSRQQKRRAAAAAAAAVADSGDEEYSGGEALLVGDDEKKKENEDDEIEKHAHDDEPFLKKKNGAKAKVRKKTSRKRA